MALSDGQEQALVELRSIADQGPAFEVLDAQEASSDVLRVDITVSMAGIQRTKDGLPLRQRERFILLIESGFPFAVPTVWTPHRRWAGWPHVQWGRYLCLFESPETDWDASDGAYGFVERLLSWLERAAVNQLDETGQPLHPPAVYVRNAEGPVVLPRADTPVVADEPWIGLTSLHCVTDRRVDIEAWSTLASYKPEANRRVGVAALLATELTFEFPEQVGDLLAALSERGVPRRDLLFLLGYAALSNPSGEPLYMVVGAPMRGVRDGARRQHLAVWRLKESAAAGLKLALHRFSELPDFRELGSQAAEIIDEWSKSAAPIEWCRVDEARPEVTQRRDAGSALDWFQGRRISVWGCGAIGAHVAEILARAGVSALVLRDKATVKNGVLVRQPFADLDIGQTKTAALAERLVAIRPELSIERIDADIITDLLDGPDWTDGSDLVIDATASETVAKKFERVRTAQSGGVPPVASMSFGRNASRGMLTVATPKYTGGTRDLIRKSRVRVCSRPEYKEIADDFWPIGDAERFYPEPGCSEPTFTGSHAQVLQLVGSMLAKLGVELADERHSLGSSSFFGTTGVTPARSTLDFRFSADITLQDGHSGYEVRISTSARDDLGAHVRRSRRRAGAVSETGGHLFGERDSAAQVVWVDEITGPPPDSEATPTGFVCGTLGVTTVSEAKRSNTRGATRFIGMWHSHPGGEPIPSQTDHAAMRRLLATSGDSPRLQYALQLIVGGDMGANATLSAMLFSRFQQTKLEPLQRAAKRSRSRACLVPRPQNRDVALALSGGGFRAVAFQLGCLRALHDRGLLDRVHLISAASGGALLAAMYGYSTDDFDEFERRVEDLLRSGITPRVVRRAAFSRRAVQALATGATGGVVALGALGLRFLAGVLSATGLLGRSRLDWVNRLGPSLTRTYSRTTAFSDVLRRSVGSTRLRDMRRPGLDVIINATELRTGTAFRFGNRESGSWQFGRVQANDVELAEAVAASAAYPTLLPAIDTHYDFVGRDGSVRRERVVLSDGGIYDNLATSALEPGRDPEISLNVFPSRIIISCDAGQGGGLNRPPYLWPERVAAAASTTHRRSQNLTRSRLFNLEQSGELDALVTAFLGMADSNIPYAPPDLASRERAVSYPTDFSPMHQSDIDMLSTRGEQLMDRLAAYYLRS